jgi:hypothetical protein
MKKNSFKVGDRVTCIKVYDGKQETLNEVGTVVDAPDTEEYVGVSFDKLVQGHDCNGRCDPGYGWYFHTNVTRYLVLSIEESFEFSEEEYKNLLNI